MEAMELIQLTEIRTVHPANDVSKAQMIADQKKIKEQHKISLEAGRREVVGWIRETAIMGYKENELGVKPPTDLVVDLYSWQAKLKEWGLKEVNNEC